MNEFHARFLPHIRSPDRFLRRAASFPPRMRSLEIALFEHELGNGVDFILVCRTHAGRTPKNVPLLFLVRSYYIIVLPLARPLSSVSRGRKFIGDSRDKQRANRDIGSCVRGYIPHLQFYQKAISKITCSDT